MPAASQAAPANAVRMIATYFGALARKATIASADAGGDRDQDRDEARRR